METLNSITNTPRTAGSSPLIGRRSFLVGAAAAALAGARGPQAILEAAPPDLERGLIDAHVHVWTPEAQKYPLAAGFRRDQMLPPSFTPDQLMAHAAPAGVDRVVLVQMSFYGFDNSYMLEVIRDAPQRYRGIAVIDDTALQPEQEMRRLAKAGVRGFRIYPRNLPIDHWLDHVGMAAMWQCGAEDGLAMCHLVNPNALPAIDRMCEQHPDTPVVIDHLARIGVNGTIKQDDVQALCKLARRPRTFVKVSAFYALGAKKPPYLDLAPMIRQVYDAFGPQRLMWASDCPFQVDEQSYADSVALVRERLDFLSPGDREWMLRKTAESVFFA